MPTNYSGNPANVTTPLIRTVTNCAASSDTFVTVTTSIAHQYATYDTVQVKGVVGTTEANTSAVIKVLDSTQFVMNGVVFVNAYVSGGTATDVSLTPYFQMASDGEFATVQSIEAAIQCLADRSQYLQNKTGNVETVTFNSSSTFRTGNSDIIAGVAACGGGGGGGGGGNGSTAMGERGGGGGGGGGSLYSNRIYALAANTTYTVTIGAGGSAGVSTGAGGDGGDTTIAQGMTTIATFPGAAGGQSGAASSTSNFCALGGPGTHTTTAGQWLFPSGNHFDATTNSGSPFVLQTGQGGPGGNTTSASRGMLSANGYAGGVAGAQGAGSSHLGGGGGGGGAGGPFGVGGTATGGGAGNDFGPGNPPSGSPGAGAANSGAGGGGGGGGGCGSSALGNGGAGGSGGSGVLYLMYIGTPNNA